MKKKRKLKKKVLVLFILIIILLFLLVGLFVYTKMDNKSPATNKPKVVDKISDYGYVLEDNKPKVYKDLFKKLIDVLNEDEVDYEEYASLIAQMAVVDFYNLENKTSKNDIGGAQFILSEYKDNFILEASETVYKYVEQNVDGKRKQELPEVTSSSSREVKTEKYSYQKIKDDNAYSVDVTLEYKKDLGYPKTVNVKLVHKDKKLEIYQMK